MQTLLPFHPIFHPNDPICKFIFYQYDILVLRSNLSCITPGGGRFKSCHRHKNLLYKISSCTFNSVFLFMVCHCFQIAGSMVYGDKPLYSLQWIYFGFSGFTHRYLSHAEVLSPLKVQGKLRQECKAKRRTEKTINQQNLFLVKNLTQFDQTERKKKTFTFMCSALISKISRSMKASYKSAPIAAKF